ncbi:MAG: PAS domain S-box protein [Candidatus Methylumidiphilus sp.]
MESIENLTLADIMSRTVLSVSPQCTLAEAARSMGAAHISSIVVVADARPAGILTERDLARLLRDKADLETPVAELMSSPVLTAPSDLGFRAAFNRLRQHSVHHLVVVNPAGEAVGIASATDFRTHLGLDAFRKAADLRSVMEQTVSSLPPAATLAAALELMVGLRRNYVLVVEGALPVGIVTERDLPPLLARHADPAAIRLGEVMSSPVHSLPPESSAAEAAQRMAQHRIRHMPVVDVTHGLVGVVSQNRLLEQIGIEFLEDACRDQESLSAAKSDAENRLQLVLEATGLGIWEYDHGRDRMTWSPALCALLGYGLAQVPAHLDDWLALIHADDRPDVLRRIEAALAADDPLYQSEYRMRNGGGGWQWVAAQGRVLRRGQDGRPLWTAGTMADISRRKNTEQLLQAQHDLAVSVAGEPSRDGLLQAILGCALSLPELDGGGVYWRQADGGYALVGHRGLSAQFVASVASLAADSWQAQLVREGQMRHSSQQPPHTGTDLRLLTAEPNIVAEGITALVVLPVLAGGEAVACLNLASKHTASLRPETLAALETLTQQFNQALQRQLAQEEAARQRENLQRFFSALDDYLFIIGMDGLILHYNPAVAEQLGYGQTLIGLPVAAVHPEDVREEASQIMAEMIAGTRKHCPLPLRKADGQTIWVDTRVVQGHWNGKSAIFGISRDVTEQRRRQEDLARSETLLRMTLDATDDGILVVGADGRMLCKNLRFQELWQIPDRLAESGQDARMLAYVLDQLAEPKDFLRQVRRIYRSDEERWDIIRFKDGRVFERLTRPLRIGGERARLWSFRDITAAEQAKAMLRERAALQQRLERIVATAPGVVYSFRMGQDGSVCFPYASPAIEELFGLRPEELRQDASVIWQIVHPDDLPRFRSRIAESVQAAAPWQDEFRVKVPGKGEMWIEGRALPAAEADGGVLFHGFLTDISERKRADRALAEEAVRRRVLFEQSKDGIVVLSLDGQVQDLNQSFADMLGYGIDEVRRLHAWDWDLRFDREQLLHKLQGFTVSSATFETRHRRKDGSIIDMEVSASAARHEGQTLVYGFHRDISGRKRLENEMRQREHYQRALLDNFPFPVWLKDEESRFLAVNRPFAQACGRAAPDELAGQTDYDVWPAELAEAYRADDREVLRSGRAKNVEEPLQQGGGRSWIETYKSPVAVDGRVIGTVGYARDISDRKQMETALRVSQERLSLALQGGNDGLWDWNLETGEVYYSPRWKAMLGYAEDELEGTLDTWARLVHPQDKDPTLRHVADHVEGRTPRYEIEFRMRHKYGHWVDVLSRGTLARDATGQPRTPKRLVGTHIDITERKTLLARLERQAAFTQAVIDAEVDGLAVCHGVADPPYARFTVWNPAMASLTGYSLEEINRLGWYQTVYADPETQERARLRMERMRQGEHLLGEEWAITRKDGGLRTVQIHTRIVAEDGDGSHVLAVMHDVTASRQAEEHLRQLSTAIEQAPVSVVITDLQPRILYANPRFTAITGYTLDEVVGKNPSLSQSGLTPMETYEDMWATITAGRPWQGELHNRRKNGETFYEEAHIAPVIDKNGAITHYVAIKQDISARKRMESELRESESRFRAIYEQSLFGIALVTLDEWRFIAANPAYCQMLGYAEEELRQKTVLDIIDLEDAPTRQIISARQQQPAGHFVIDARHRAKNGGTVWTTLASAAISESAGQPAYRLVMVENITDRHHIEQALKELNDSLEQRVREESAKNREKDHLLIQQSRLAAMGEMIGNIAHQWRQPLNALGLTLANLEDAHRYNELTGDYLASQVATGQRLIQKMSSTIDDFRHFFRPSKQAQSFSAKAAVNEAIALLSASFANNAIAVAVEADEDVLAQGYANEFSQVLLNLFANAKDAILQRKVAHGNVSVRLAQDGAWATITVADNGGGIPQEAIGKIFEPYFSTKEMGTGIGLYMSKMIIENSMHGQISVRNHGDGAEFTLRCPLAPPQNHRDNPP